MQCVAFLNYIFHVDTRLYHFLRLPLSRWALSFKYQFVINIHIYIICSTIHITFFVLLNFYYRQISYKCKTCDIYQLAGFLVKDQKSPVQFTMPLKPWTLTFGLFNQFFLLFSSKYKIDDDMLIKKEILQRENDKVYITIATYWGKCLVDCNV